MSLRSQPIAPVPPDTVRVARAAFPKGTPYLTLRDALGAIFQDHAFADLYSREGQPGLAPWQLALVTGEGVERLLDTLLIRCRELGLLKARGQQRTDAPHVLALQRHFSVLTKFAHVESRLSGRLRRRKVIFYKPVNLCDRRACSASVAVGLKPGRDSRDPIRPVCVWL